MKNKRKLTISWLIVINLVFSLFISACSAQPTPTNIPTDTPTDTLTDTPTDIPTDTPTTMSATYKNPAPESVIYSEVYGYIPVNQLVVVFEDSVDKAAIQKAIKQIGGTVVAEMEIINLYQLEMDFTTEAELTTAIDTALAMEGVEAAFPNVEVYGKDIGGTTCSLLKDPVFEDPANAAHYNTIGMENAWRIIKVSGVELNKVNVGVLDTAIYTGSDEFKGKATVNGDTTEDPEKDENGEIVDGGLSHGTMVTHVIGADPENSGMVGIAGVLEEKLNIDVKNLFDGKKERELAAPDPDDFTQGVRIIGEVEYTYTIKALAYLQEQVDNGATVINCSYGPDKPDDSLEWVSKAYEKFFKKMQETNPDVVFVAAAGNESDADKSKGALNGKNYYPAGLNLPNVITVGAIENDGNRARFSNFATEGAEVTLSAPGVEMVLGVDEAGRPIKASGTSFSAPQVTAAIALIQSINPKLSAAEIKELLKETAAPGVTTYAEPGKIGPTDQSIPIPEGMGAGVLRVDEAVLKTINDMRVADGKAPFALADLLDNTLVSLRAEGGPLEYVITAGIASAQGGGGSYIKLEVSGGQYAIAGSSTQNAIVGGEVSWKITLDEDEVFVRVTRLDNGGCAFLTLTPEAGHAQMQTMAGTFTGSAILQYVADEVEAEDSLPVTIYCNEGGTGTANVYGYDGEAECSTNKVAFTVSMESIYASFSGTVRRSGSYLVISGSIRMFFMGQHFATYSLTATK